MWRLALPLVLLSVFLNGCQWLLYVPDVQQGNVITQDMVDKLKPGMTPRQVRFVLGSPLVTDPFHQQRWDYYFALIKDGASDYEQRRLTLFFESAKLVRMETHPEPEKDDSNALRIEPRVYDRSGASDTNKAKPGSPATSPE
ncbi:MAG: hypothetical protein BMS9Abin36_0122 [Gammaproteobacteria bacterium]|nr:MAG: hypothetical protein BMS9Abin36_0122 [Gammaproteobacteria bacterium]